MKHRLIIHSLRDTSATCSCGRWHYTTTSRPLDSENFLLRRAKGHHVNHIIECRKQQQFVNHNQQNQLQ